MVYEYAQMETKEVAKRLGDSGGMWIVIIVVLCVFIGLLDVIIVCGGKKEDQEE